MYFTGFRELDKSHLMVHCQASKARLQFKGNLEVTCINDGRCSIRCLLVNYQTCQTYENDGQLLVIVFGAYTFIITYTASKLQNILCLLLIYITSKFNICYY